MTEADAVHSLNSGPEIEIKIKGSRFLGRAFEAVTEDEARAELAALKKKAYDATHHCSAWKIGPPEKPIERHDDDGEPSGSAGPPILGAIHQSGLTNALVVVTRYYGGTKLGTGGLVKAYGEAARLALAEAPRKTLWRRESLVIRCAFDDLGPVETLVGKAAAHTLDVERVFEPEPEVRLVLKQSRVDDLANALVEATAGRVKLERESLGIG